MAPISPSLAGWGAPTERERADLEVRLARISDSATSIHTANQQFEAMRTEAPDGRAAWLRLRNGYAYRTDAPNNASDRKAPTKADRPPASALVSSRGSALRFHLLALAEAQLRVKAGASPGNPRPLRPTGDADGWTDLLGSWAQPHSGQVYVNAANKRVRQIQTALITLEKNRLVVLPNKSKGAGKYEGFLLLDETASRKADEEPLPYVTPGPRESDLFTLPMSFITTGWVHVLEDGEISVLLMLACGIGSISSDALAIPSKVRVEHYGIVKERFEAHRWLAKFGLIDVEAVDRNPDGRAINYSEDGGSLHRIRLRPEGFEQPSVETVQAALLQRLSMGVAAT